MTSAEILRAARDLIANPFAGPKVRLQETLLATPFYGRRLMLVCSPQDSRWCR